MLTLYFLASLGLALMLFINQILLNRKIEKLKMTIEEINNSPFRDIVNSITADMKAKKNESLNKIQQLNEYLEPRYNILAGDLMFISYVYSKYQDVMYVTYKKDGDYFMAEYDEMEELMSIPDYLLFIHEFLLNKYFEQEVKLEQTRVKDIIELVKTCDRPMYDEIRKLQQESEYPAKLLN